MTVALPNCTALVKSGNSGSQLIANAEANLQKLGMGQLNQMYPGIDIDRRPSHRIRIDAAVNPADPSLTGSTIPTEGDLVFVSYFPAAPWCLGLWEIIDIDYDTGALASLILYIKRPVMSQTGISMAV